ncbi:MAG: hypothetical protein AAFQ19_07175 [Pseudomonadota bacterium]
MSASDTEIEKQAKRHSPSLIGISVAVASVVVVIVAIMAFGYGPGVDEASSAEPTNESLPLGAD